MQEQELIQLLSCPYCSASFDRDGEAVRCGQGHIFPRAGTSLDLLPTEEMHGEEWSRWEEKQHLGNEDYEHPDAEYLEQSNAVASLFGEFCEFHGKVLDIGCGIHAQLAYVKNEVYQKTFYVGIDPLAGSEERPYHFVRGIAERLPFVDQAFDQVILATSLDHIIALEPVLKEVRRVLKPTGTVNLWVTVIERTQTKDITLLNWLKELAFHVSRFRWRAAWQHFVVPFSVKGWDYRSTDQYHFHRFTRDTIEKLFSRFGFHAAQVFYLETPSNPDSKHLFGKYAKQGLPNQNEEKPRKESAIGNLRETKEETRQ